MNTNKIDLIKAEVERLKSQLLRGACSSQIAMETRCKEEAYDEVISLLDSLQEEPVKIKKGCKYRSICNVTNNDTGNISFVAGKIYLAPEDDTLVSEENGWLCDTSEDASNFELVEEPVSIWHDASEKPERDDLLIETNDGRIIHRQSINNYGMVKRGAYTSDLLNLDNSCNFGKNLQEEPVSEDLEDEYNNYIDIHDGEWTKDDYLAFARHFANWGSKHHKPIGEDFEKVVSDFLDQYTYPREEVDFLQFALYINSWAKEQISKHYHLNNQDLDIAAEKCEESWVKVGIEPQKKGDYVSIFKAGANWQREKMMKDAVDGRFSYNHNFKENEFICLEKSDTPEHYLGELVKVIIIKQEEE